MSSKGYYFTKTGVSAGETAPGGIIVKTDAAPVVSEIEETKLSDKEKTIFEDKLLKSATQSPQYDSLGNPIGEKGTIISRKLTTSLFFSEDKVGRFSLYFFMTVIYWLYALGNGIAALVAMFGDYNDFNVTTFFEATSIIGAIVFVFTLGSMVRYMQQFSTFSPKHNRAIYEPFLVFTAMELVAWIAVLVWTKDYDLRHVNSHAPDQLAKYYVGYIIYLIAAAWSIPTFAGFVFSSFYPEHKKPDIVVMDEKNQVWGSYMTSEKQMMETTAINKAADDVATAAITTKVIDL